MLKKTLTLISYSDLTIPQASGPLIGVAYAVFAELPLFHLPSRTRPSTASRWFPPVQSAITGTLRYT